MMPISESSINCFQGSVELHKSSFHSGYDNLIDTDGDGFGGRFIDPNKNSGRADLLYHQIQVMRTHSLNISSPLIMLISLLLSRLRLLCP